MDPLTFAEAASFCGGKISGDHPEGVFTGVSTDTRQIKPGSLFIALRGERFDAHDFALQALEQGAAGIVVSQAQGLKAPAGSVKIEVADTLSALQQIARGYRSKLPVRTVAVTGSNGKTSTKEFTAAVLSEKLLTSKTEGNLNNHIGVPLTVLQMDSGLQAAVVEMGMNHPGELAPLMDIAQPVAGIVTNVSAVHIENFDNEEGIAHEKAVVVRKLPATGHAIVNLDNRWTPLVVEGVHAKILTFGIDNARATLSATGIRTGQDGIYYTLQHEGKSMDAFSPVFGEHMVYNAMAASLAGLVFGLEWEEICAGLAKVRIPGMRMQQIRVNGVNVINDAYNANPVSVEAGLKTLKTLAGAADCHAVLGTMYELGGLADSAHRKIGQLAAELGLRRLYVRGEYAAQIAGGALSAGMNAASIMISDSPVEMATALNCQCQPGDFVLIKGSRGAKMEEVLAAWQQLK